MKDKLLDLVKTSRPISWVNTAYPFAAGYIVLTHRIDVRLIIGTIFFLVPYNLLMYGINDVFDYESDLQNPRKGGVEGAVLERGRHQLVLKASIGLAVPFIIYLLSIGSWPAKLVFMYSIFMVIAYSAPKLRFKERPFLDSFTSSTHFVSPLVYALVLVGWKAEYWPYVAAFFLWGMASHAFGAVQDIIADRAGRISSIGTVFGAAWTTRFALFCYCLSAGLLFAQANGAKYVAAAVILYVLSVIPYADLKDKDCETAHKGWERFLWLNWITGFVVTIVLIGSFKHWF